MHHRRSLPLGTCHHPAPLLTASSLEAGSCFQASSAVQELTLLEPGSGLESWLCYYSALRPQVRLCVLWP